MLIDLATDAIFHTAFLDMGCIFSLNWGTPGWGFSVQTGSGVYKNQSMQDQQWTIPDIPTNQHLDNIFHFGVMLCHQQGNFVVKFAIIID